MTCVVTIRLPSSQQSGTLDSCLRALTLASSSPSSFSVVHNCQWWFVVVCVFHLTSFQWMNHFSGYLSVDDHFNGNLYLLPLTLTWLCHSHMLCPISVPDALSVAHCRICTDLVYVPNALVPSPSQKQLSVTIILFGALCLI